MSPITVALTSSSTSSHVPLAALGYALRRANVLAPVLDLELPIKLIDHTPTEKLVTGLMLILAGGRALYQANWLLRPNTALACAWGQAEFAEQSTISDTFDALRPEDLDGVQAAFATLTRNWSQTCHHDFRRGDLILDGDLTGLPASRHADGSRKGYFSGKKSLWAASRAGHLPPLWRIAGVVVIPRHAKRPKLPATVGTHDGRPVGSTRRPSTPSPLALGWRVWY